MSFDREVALSPPACATDQELATTCTHTHKVVHTEDFGQVTFTIEARTGCPIQLTKYMVYHTSQIASRRRTACARRNGSGNGPGFRICLPHKSVYGRLLAPRQYPYAGYQGGTQKQIRSEEIQRAFALISSKSCRPRRGRKIAGVPAKALPRQLYGGIISEMPEITTYLRFGIRRPRLLRIY